MKKIAIILPSKLPVPAVKGGAIEKLVEIFLEQNERHKDFRIIVFSQHDKAAELKSYKYSLSHFIWVDKIPFFGILNLLNKVLRKLNLEKYTLFEIIILKMLNRFKPDSVLVEGNERFINVIYNTKQRYKIIFHVHSNLFKRFSNRLLDSLNKSDVVITVSDFLRRELLNKYQINGNKVKVVKNCVSPEFYFEGKNKNEIKSFLNKYMLNENTIKIAYIGRIVAGKGVKELFYALNEVQKIHDFKFILVGTSNNDFGSGKIRSKFYDELINISPELNKRTVWTGYIDNSKIKDVLDAIDILVQPSIDDEGAPLTVIEGMARGTTLITTDSGGIPEYINKKSALIIKRSDNFVNDLKNTIIRLIEDNDLRNNIKREAIIHSKNFDVESYYLGIKKYL